MDQRDQKGHQKNIFNWIKMKTQHTKAYGIS